MTTSKSSLRSEYLSKWPLCQYTQACRSKHRPATEIEHIWNRRGPKSEHVSNYASVCRVAHEWKHRNSVIARIAISHFKWKLALSTGDSSHFDLDALKELSGRHVIGWVEMKMETDVLPEWCRKLGVELMEGNQ